MHKTVGKLAGGIYQATQGLYQKINLKKCRKFLMK